MQCNDICTSAVCIAVDTVSKLLDRYTMSFPYPHTTYHIGVSHLVLPDAQNLSILDTDSLIIVLLVMFLFLLNMVVLYFFWVDK